MRMWDHISYPEWILGTQHWIPRTCIQTEMPEGHSCISPNLLFWLSFLCFWHDNIPNFFSCTSIRARGWGGNGNILSIFFTVLEKRIPSASIHVAGIIPRRIFTVAVNTIPSTYKVLSKYISKAWLLLLLPKSQFQPPCPRWPNKLARSPETPPWEISSVSSRLLTYENTRQYLLMLQKLCKHLFIVSFFSYWKQVQSQSLKA